LIDLPGFGACGKGSIKALLRANGYLPIPLFGKVPPLKSWQDLTVISPDMIRMWSRTWPDADNTGALTRYMPALDLDITHEPAVIAVEDYVRDKFEERGWFLVRIGKPPKRAILLRTDAPFRKLTAPLISPHDGAEKIELLASGQQLVDGIHPDTKQPYHWFGGEPWTIERGELPYIHEGEARGIAPRSRWRCGAETRRAVSEAIALWLLFHPPVQRAGLCTQCASLSICQ
jgi:Bifunctional DNA primase/polymerase, N-terminal